ncbi:hypothetical protein [Vibrio vulnificus YJ016]|uniref:Uncharacterized protein n=1 Tax=Vibrio vulnificus (strain YJ016) TaxID=196600 RepID=Q7MFP0_VIBVY|nr:hypothetical protein [Vibrio vulnificus YJ016]
MLSCMRSPLNDDQTLCPFTAALQDDAADMVAVYRDIYLRRWGGHQSDLLVSLRRLAWAH